MSTNTLQKLKWFYSNEKITNTMVTNCINKEIAGSYNGKGYTARPDILDNNGDIMFLVKKGITSFHMSEETWSNPMFIKKEENGKNNYNKIRIGWDLIFDVDCKNFDLAKVFSHLIIKALKDHDITAITCKFSGNKGFHIAVPFEAFPKELNGKKVVNLFPELPRAICAYLTSYISKKYIKLIGKKVCFDGVCFDMKIIESFAKKEDFISELCPFCFKTKKKSFEDVALAGNKTTKRIVNSEKCCSENYMKKYEFFIDLNSFDFIDSALVSPRHLFRTIYSNHEKSGLFSVPVDINKVLEFDKKQAEIDNIDFNIPFLIREVNEECENLFVKSMDFKPPTTNTYDDFSDFTPMDEEVPFEQFPPCVINFLNGVEDGNKRGVFYVINFLKCCGYSSKRVKEVLYTWNNKHHKLRETYLKSQIKYANKIILPPNCNNENGFKGILVCKPNEMCRRIKNPVKYSTNLNS